MLEYDAKTTNVRDFVLETTNEGLDKREKRTTEDLGRRKHSERKSLQRICGIFFWVYDKVKQNILETVTGTKWAPPYACVFMEKLEPPILKAQKYQPLALYQYIDEMLFTWTHGETKVNTIFRFYGWYF